MIDASIGITVSRTASGSMSRATMRWASAAMSWIVSMASPHSRAKAGAVMSLTHVSARISATIVWMRCALTSGVEGFARDLLIR